MIDIRSHTTFTTDSWRAIEDAVLDAGPPYAVLAHPALANEIALDGVGSEFLYVRDTEIQVVFSEDAVLAPRGFDLDAAKAAASRDVGEAVAAYVEQRLPVAEQNRLSALLQQAMLYRTEGRPVNEWALMVLLATLSWAKAAYAYTRALRAQIAAANTLVELRRVVVEAESLGDPPQVDAADLDEALG